MKGRYSFWLAVILLAQGALSSAPTDIPTIYRDPDAQPTLRKAQIDIIAVADPKRHSPVSDGTVAVIGCGKDLGRVEVPAGLSVVDAISAAGGLNRLSSRTVLSIVTDGRRRIIQFSGLDVESADGIALYSRIILGAGDILTISEGGIF